LFGKNIKNIQKLSHASKVHKIIFPMFSSETKFKRMNCKKYLLPIKNCLYDFNTLKSREYTNDDYFTDHLDYDYDRNVNSEFLETFLKEVFTDDHETIRYFLLEMGTALSGKKDNPRSNFLYTMGPNGKTMLFLLLEYSLRPFYKWQREVEYQINSFLYVFFS